MCAFNAGVSRSPRGQAQKNNEIRRLDLPGVGAIASGDPSRPLLLCLHGWGGSRDIWRRFLSLYGPDRYLVSVDLPGTWETGAVEPWTAGALTKWVLSLADSLGARRFAVMGHSMGGNLAAHTASAAPDRVTDLILVNAAVYSDRLESARYYLSPRYGRQLLVAARLGSGFLGIFSELLREPKSGGVWRPWLRRCRYFYHHNRSDAMARQLQCLVDSPFDPARLGPDVNVLICHGENDTLVPVALARELEEAVRDSRPAQDGGRVQLLVYSGASHTPMDVHPIQFAGDVRRFLGDDA